VQILHTYYTFLSTVDYKFLFSSLQLWWSYARPPSSHRIFKKSTIGRNVRCHFLTFSPNSWEFLVQVLHTYYIILSTLDYTFLFNYLQRWRSCAILRATTQRAFRPTVDILSIWRWSRLIWHNFVRVTDNWIKIHASHWRSDKCQVTSFHSFDIQYSTEQHKINK